MEEAAKILVLGGTTEYFHGKVHGHILEQPLDVGLRPGFPFRSIFWVDGIDMPIY
jgi:inosine/xanthosine triphosphate pyrophosphatase family protein